MMMATSSVFTSLSIASAAAPETTSSYTSQSPPSDACSARKWRTLRSARTESTSSMNSAPTTIVCTPASSTMKVSSGPARRKFKGTKTAPSLPQAKSTSRNSGTLIVSTATRSPWHTPRSDSAVAHRSTCSLSERYVHDRPSKTSAVRAGESSAHGSQPAHRSTGGDQGFEGHEVHGQLDAEDRTQLEGRGHQGRGQEGHQEVGTQEGVGEEDQQVPQKALTKGREIRMVLKKASTARKAAKRTTKRKSPAKK